MPLATSPRYMRQIAATSADREIGLLYDEAIATLRAVIKAIAEDDIEGRCRGVYAATETITSLYLKLDIRRFGEYADDWADLHGHILGCLVGINLYNDSRIASDAIELLHSLKEQIAAATGTVSACSPAKRYTHAVDGTTPEHRA